MNAETKRDTVNQLIEKYVSYAEALARSLAPRLPMQMEMDEVLSLARMGLVEAAQKFDASRQVSFKTFAYYRIRGAIYDGIRSMGPLSREQVLKLKFQRGMDYYLQQESGTREPAPGTVGQPDLERLKSLMTTMTSVYLLSMDSTLEHRELPSEGAESPLESCERNEAITWLRQAIKKLSVQEQQIIRMYYYENRTLDEIGQTLDLSRSWVCRMHARIIKKLHQIFKKAELGGKTMLRV